MCRLGPPRLRNDDAFSTGYIVVRRQQAALCGHIHQQCVKNQIFVFVVQERGEHGHPEQCVPYLYVVTSRQTTILLSIGFYMILCKTILRSH